MRLAEYPTFSDFLSWLGDNRILTAESVKRARNAHSSTGHPVDTVFIELGLLRESDLAQHLSAFLGVPVLPAVPDEVDLALVRGIGMNFLEANQVLPLAFVENRVLVAAADPFARSTLDVLRYHFDCEPELRVFPRSAIAERLRTLKETKLDSPDSLLMAVDDDLADTDDIERLRDFAREAPVIRFVANIIQQAVDRGATDIHVEPTIDHLRIRFRCDGLLTVAETAPKSMHAGIATRIKILSRLNIAERRMPQDGRMRVTVRGQEIDLRVSVLPSVHGETFVLRILDKSGVALSLNALGFDAEAIARFKEFAHIPNGIVLITGPTGSGKTTTLYSLLKERDPDEVKIFTVEDPVEYRLDGITQLQVDPAIDLTFARALRSVLRQDPDVILIGEIRDAETAQIAIQASLTGHLVFSTLHTNSAAGALTRLLDMGIDGYLIGATIRAVAAQRLVRKLCPKCHGVQAPAVNGIHPVCNTCRGSGYAGRTVAYEILEVSPEIASMISRGAGEEQMQERAAANGFLTMSAQAARLVADGVTTREEVQRVLSLDLTTDLADEILQ
ncbi:GspE/PulE family protein [Mesorhizobium australicum]|uniref:Type II secretion system protein E (GspE) n=1 Tax=Mesorhizobium australicum TaxID=536018 RepID=A0A1X7NTZ9_9HYPH|nr:GspE/PulE family protein [Mesorhizobium australicum]SMH41673.1 type II secretion system protein E (GspE) [Mesorhizobium australicum]